MKNLFLAAMILTSVTAFSATAAKATLEVVDAMALASPADVQKFNASGNKTISVTKSIVDGEEVYSLMRQACHTNGTSPSQCLGGAQLTIRIKTKIIMSNAVKVGESSVVGIR